VYTRGSIPSKKNQHAVIAGFSQLRQIHFQLLLAIIAFAVGNNTPVSVWVGDLVALRGNLIA
jgi:hypothetical protein